MTISITTIQLQHVKRHMCDNVNLAYKSFQLTLRQSEDELGEEPLPDVVEREQLPHAPRDGERVERLPAEPLHVRPQAPLQLLAGRRVHHGLRLTRARQPPRAPVRHALVLCEKGEVECDEDKNNMVCMSRIETNVGIHVMYPHIYLFINTIYS